MTKKVRIVTLPNLWKRFLLLKPEEKRIDTLTAFVRDTEHEIVAVVTALQAHIDLLHEELVRADMPVDRFTILNHALARLITDTDILSSVCDLVQAPRSKQGQLLEGLMQDITQETRLTFTNRQVALTCDIASGTTLVGNAIQLKALITATVLAILQTCESLGTVSVVARTLKKSVVVSFDTGLSESETMFTPWRLGELRLVPTNGDGIRLAAVDAMARLQQGQLSVSTSPDHRRGYKLIFNAAGT